MFHENSYENVLGKCKQNTNTEVKLATRFFTERFEGYVYVFKRMSETSDDLVVQHEKLIDEKIAANIVVTS